MEIHNRQVFGFHDKITASNVYLTHGYLITANVHLMERNYIYE